MHTPVVAMMTPVVATMTLGVFSCCVETHFCSSSVAHPFGIYSGGGANCPSSFYTTFEILNIISIWQIKSFVHMMNVHFQQCQRSRKTSMQSTYLYLANGIC